MRILWLDDVRDPKDHGYPKAKWVKSYIEFVAEIMLAWPDFISFDHDLGKEYHWEETVHFEEGETPPDEHRILYDDFVEKTGYHAAKWLVEYCMDHNKELPKWAVHSMNVVGRANIEGLLKNFENAIRRNLD